MQMHIKHFKVLKTVQYSVWQRPHKQKKIYILKANISFQLILPPTHFGQLQNSGIWEKVHLSQKIYLHTILNICYLKLKYSSLSEIQPIGTVFSYSKSYNNPRCNPNPHYSIYMIQNPPNYPNPYCSIAATEPSL